MTSLRHQLRHLEQENDDLHSSVRQLQATETDLRHQIERAQEQVVFIQQELEMAHEEHERDATRSMRHIARLTTQVRSYHHVLNHLCTVMGLPPILDDTSMGQT
ncbi:hypothetical protein PsorP6_018493 [Peronosclerospora sorghi]|nr:hypothetical protein PsorP6_018964 [Peronosclerospora sorghi]KAI9895827.1 hypothetical protein PsorP6_018490 [Peronosclerospora sorghi]KAI9895830.1 hypothetical protein PsorP6_018493 [Peronosclerospora sorghi]